MKTVLEMGWFQNVRWQGRRSSARRFAHISLLSENVETRRKLLGIATSIMTRLLNVETRRYIFTFFLSGVDVEFSKLKMLFWFENPMYYHLLLAKPARRAYAISRRSPTSNVIWWLLDFVCGDERCGKLYKIIKFNLHYMFPSRKTQDCALVDIHMSLASTKFKTVNGLPESSRYYRLSFQKHRMEQRQSSIEVMYKS